VVAANASVLRDLDPHPFRAERLGRGQAASSLAPPRNPKNCSDRQHVTVMIDDRRAVDGDKFLPKASVELLKLLVQNCPRDNPGFERRGRGQAIVRMYDDIFPGVLMGARCPSGQAAKSCLGLARVDAGRGQAVVGGDGARPG
jgi:hypothetical protein